MATAHIKRGSCAASPAMASHLRKPLNKSPVTVADDLISMGNKPSGSSNSKSTSNPTLSRQKNRLEAKPALNRALRNSDTIRVSNSAPLSG
ncbi:hypothetical protein [Rhodoferax sp. OV413]|uniref:hypothetical protein n=1 Tax=Rhodoferax sp. OV413 TaxID=1855285 RepID=UPI0025E185E9|nr:hypothetical protein [Rhodoferax sp. OV413]